MECKQIILVVLSTILMALFDGVDAKRGKRVFY